MPTVQAAATVRRRIALFCAAAILATLVAAPIGASAASPVTRFATFNASLNRGAAGQALTDLSAPGNAQADAVAEIIQRVRPEVLLINEFDFYTPTAAHPDGPLVDAFRDNYLEIAHNGAAAIDYPYSYVAPSNTGISSGFDLNNNGVTDTTPGDNPYGDDSMGFGVFEGQFGMVVYSQHPILTDDVRTFQHFLWKDMPDALLPDDPATPAAHDWYNADELAIFPLSSKSHWDVPIDIDGAVVHFLVSHPTPPGLRRPRGPKRHEELGRDPPVGRLHHPGACIVYIYDDDGTHGGLKPGSAFVIAGDQNSDPLDGDSIPGSIQQLLEHPLVNTSVTPTSDGGAYWSELQDVLNDTHETDPHEDTADFCDTPAFPPCSGPGNLRADYVLPRRSLKIVDAAVFWPFPPDELVRLTGAGFPVPSSDHRLVWVDVRIPG